MIYPVILALIVSLYAIYSFPEVKGWVGEIAVKTCLLLLPKSEFIVMNDIYIPAYDGMFTQIDHIIVASCGIIVIETKNYSGKLSGSSRKKYWASNNRGDVIKVYNPIRQNAYHIRMLRENCLGIKKEKIYSVICMAFGVKADINTNIPIVSPLKLKKIIVKLNRSKVYGESERRIIASMVKEIVIDRSEAAKKHKAMLYKRHGKIKKGICPRCEARLNLKRGVRGEYLICSNYPICKFRISNRV